jgi:hypothetical protein
MVRRKLIGASVIGAIAGPDSGSLTEGTMKTRILNTLILSATVAIPLALTPGCSHEVSHTESDKPGMFGGQTHEETTVYKNADGTTSVEHEKHSTSP